MNSRLLLLEVAHFFRLSTGPDRWVLGEEVQYGFGPWLNPRPSGGQGVDDYPGYNPHLKRVGPL